MSADDSADAPSPRDSLTLNDPPTSEPPMPFSSSHRDGSRAYAGRSGYEDTATSWQSANIFEHCIAVRIDGARGLPESYEMICEVQAGPRVTSVPLLLSQADMEAGGGGRSGSEGAVHVVQELALEVLEIGQSGSNAQRGRWRRHTHTITSNSRATECRAAHSCSSAYGCAHLACGGVLVLIPTETQ